MSQDEYVQSFIDLQKQIERAKNKLKPTAHHSIESDRTANTYTAGDSISRSKRVAFQYQN